MILPIYYCALFPVSSSNYVFGVPILAFFVLFVDGKLSPLCHSFHTVNARLSSQTYSKSESMCIICRSNVPVPVCSFSFQSGGATQNRKK